MTVHLDPAGSPSDLIDLIRHSKLILYGHIQRLLPTVDVSRSNNGVVGNPVLETSAIVSVDTVFAGSTPNSSGSIIVPQIGGELGKSHTIVPQDPLVAP